MIKHLHSSLFLLLVFSLFEKKSQGKCWETLENTLFLSGDTLQEIRRVPTQNNSNFYANVKMVD